MVRICPILVPRDESLSPPKLVSIPKELRDLLPHACWGPVYSICRHSNCEQIPVLTALLCLVLCIVWNTKHEHPLENSPRLEMLLLPLTCHWVWQMSLLSSRANPVAKTPTLARQPSNQVRKERTLEVDEGRHTEICQGLGQGICSDECQLQGGGEWDENKNKRLLGNKRTCTWAELESSSWGLPGRSCGLRH